MVFLPRFQKVILASATNFARGELRKRAIGYIAYDASPYAPPMAEVFITALYMMKDSWIFCQNHRGQNLVSAGFKIMAELGVGVGQICRTAILPREAY
jgi:hypothetical protein